MWRIDGVRRAPTLAVIVALVACGCGTNVTDPSEVEGVTWQLTRLEREDRTSVTIQAPEQYTLSFIEGGRLAVRSDCNQCGGTYELRDDSFTVGPLACRKVFCGEQSLDV